MRRFRRLLLFAIGVLALFAASLLPRLFSSGPADERPPDETAGAPPTGRVVTASGRPAPNDTRVTAIGASGRLAETRTGADGAFRFDPVPEGTEKYEAVAGPYRGRAAARPEPVEVRLPPTFDLEGRVVDRETGAAVAGAEIRCAGRTALTGSDGKFGIEDLEPADGLIPSIEVRSDGHAPIVHAPVGDAAWDDLYIRLVRR